MKKSVLVVAMFMFVVVQSLQWLRILLRLSLQLKKQKAQRKQQLLSLQRKNLKLKSLKQKNRPKMLRLLTPPLQQKLLLSLPNNSKHTTIKSHPCFVYSGDGFFVYPKYTLFIH